MSASSNLKGTSITTFNFGKSGPILKNNGGIFEFRNADDTLYTEIKALTSTTPDGLVTKQYVDSAISGLDTKNSVRAVTDGVGDLAGFVYTPATDTEAVGDAPWTSVVAPVFDGITLLNGERVLIKDSADAKGNGIFTYDSGASKFVRAIDADNSPDNEVSGGLYVFVSEGTSLSDTGWTMSSPNGVATLGTDNLVFTQFSGAGVIIGGTNLTKVGNTINLDSVVTLFESTGIDDNASSTAITIDSANFVGVGTLSPTANLHVVGLSAKFIPSVTDFFVYVGTRLMLADTNTFGVVQSKSGAPLHLHNTSGNGIEILANNNIITTGGGNVGIGEAVPLFPLHVAKNGTASARFDGVVRLTQAAASATMIEWANESNIRKWLAYIGGGNQLRFFDDGGTDRLTLATGGNIGIGTISPDARLHVHTATAGVIAPDVAADEFVIENSANAGMTIFTPNTNQGSMYFGDPEDNNIGQIVYDHSTNGLSFVSNAATNLTLSGGSGSELATFTGEVSSTNLIGAAVGIDANQVPKNYMLGSAAYADTDNILKNGTAVEASTGTFTGEIFATNGTFTGEVSSINLIGDAIGTGANQVPKNYMLGSAAYADTDDILKNGTAVEASTGTFTGEIFATDGTFTGAVSSNNLIGNAIGIDANQVPKNHMLGSAAYVNTDDVLKNGTAVEASTGTFSTGVLFGTDTADVNTLDDYEEGTWTPALVGNGTPGTATYTTQLGRYTKIGNLVTAWGNILLSAKGTMSGTMLITGLPFSSTAVAGFNYPCAIGVYGDITITGQLSCRVQNNAAIAELLVSASAIPFASLTDGSISATSLLQFTLIYMAA